MEIGLYVLASMIHNQTKIDNDVLLFTKSIEEKLNISFTIKEKFNLIMIATGGVENKFKEIYKNFEEPYLLLSYDKNNSLAASMEILSFLKQKNLKCEIIHGNIDYISYRIKQLYNISNCLNSFKEARLGVIGSPSDWLIASEVSYSVVKEKLGISLIDIKMNELIEEINNIKEIINNEYTNKIIRLEYNKSTLNGALKIYTALKNIVKRYQLDGLTIRCFDLLNTIFNTGCLGLAILNSEGIVATCEGDIPSMLTMFMVSKYLNKQSFQANPCYINIESNEITFAHCTIPLTMINKYTLDSHFESNLGVAIKGELALGEATVFKIANDLTKYFISKAKIITNLNSKNLCRTQIVLKMDKDVNYFLTKSLGNHHIIINDNYVKEIEDLFNYMDINIKGVD